MVPWIRAGDRGARELCESRVALGEFVIQGEERVVADAEHAAAPEVAEDGGAGDLKRIGHVAGRQPLLTAPARRPTLSEPGSAFYGNWWRFSTGQPSVALPCSCPPPVFEQTWTSTPPGHCAAV